MGLTSASTGKNAMDSGIDIKNSADTVIAIAGNPNVGKSTVFNALTGMKQHTGNWAGKTVSNALGYCKGSDKNYVLVDIPGTYSLMAHSPEEEVARNFICFGDPDAVAVVCDATSLERNLNLVLQILEISQNVIVCVNLLDEAKRKGIEIKIDDLSARLGVPVVGTVARNKKTLKALICAMDKVTDKDFKAEKFRVNYPEAIEKALEITEPVIAKKIGGRLPTRWLSLRLLECDTALNKEIENFLGEDILEDCEVSQALKSAREQLYKDGIRGDRLHDMIVAAIVTSAEDICKTAVKKKDGYNSRDLKIDRILTSKKLGYPVMLLLLLAVFWLTITGSNYVSEFLSSLFSSVEVLLRKGLQLLNTPERLSSLLIDGVYRVPAWVISVMLPPMAIFFPLFTLLEDLGYLPRIAYNLDKPFKCCGSCGKQALTMCMGFGCNAAGVVGCRIIDSPRERMLAIITNSLVPCNGRFPAIIAIISMFFVTVQGFMGSVLSALWLTGVILLGVVVTFLATKHLSGTLFRGMPSSYTLEMPPYRPPQIGSVIIRSVFDRTLFVLGRSVAVAIPAGIVIWLMANVTVGDGTLLSVCADFLEPLGRLLGLDGVILMAFILGFPANEIVIPIVLMTYLSGGSLIEVSSPAQMRQILLTNDWTHTTALCFMIFSLMHWPCSTTVLTVKKETGSLKWAAFSMLFPTLLGAAACMLISLFS